jgi:mannosyl-oligosaccharide glucosidase
MKGPYEQQAGRLHDELKAAFLGNVVRVYQQSGYLYENYDQATGAGKGSHPFTGWTALIVLIASETYVQL